MPFGKSSIKQQQQQQQHATIVDSSPSASTRSSLVVGNLDAPGSSSSAHQHQEGGGHRTSHRSSSSKDKSVPPSNSSSSNSNDNADNNNNNVPPVIAARDSTLFGNEAASSLAAAASATNTIYAFGHYCHFLHKYETSLHAKFASLSAQDFDTVLHLDKWLTRTMPEHVRRRGFAKLEEVIEISDWRVQRQIRTNLALGPMVKLNTPEDVERITASAWHKASGSAAASHHHQHATPGAAPGKNTQQQTATQSTTSAADTYAWIADAMKELIVLKGVGIPTASAIMMTFWPDQCVPLQEEVFEFFFPKERALFCIATYKRYLERIRTKAGELNAERERLLNESRSDSQGNSSSSSSARKNSIPTRMSFQEGNFPCVVDLTVQFDVLKVWKAVFSFQLLKLTEDLSGG